MSTKAADRHDTPYLALSRFFDLFAKVEIATQLVLAHYSKLPLTTARGVLASFHIDDTVAALQRLLMVRKDIDKAIADDLRLVLPQLASISRARKDLLLCLPTSLPPDEFEFNPTPARDTTWDTDNGSRTDETGSAAPFRASMIFQHLDSMSTDLRKILVHLLVRHVEQPMLGPGNFHPVFAARWQYVLSIEDKPRSDLNLKAPLPSRDKRTWRQTSRFNRQRRGFARRKGP